jgi:hypothetical protein
VVTVGAATSVDFFIPDPGDRTDNSGGVSLSITPVPEPGAWALMLLGFGGMGAMLRRRRSLHPA